MVSESGRVIDELISDDCKAVLLIEVECPITCACPHESGTSGACTINPGPEEDAANAATLVRLGHRHSAQLHRKV